MRTLDSERLLEYENKWGPVIKGVFPSLKNPSMLRMLCYYSEWINSDDPSKSLPKKLSNLKERLESFDRIEIDCKVYNPSTGSFEFRLKNGKHVPVDSEFEYKLSDEEMIELFGIEFLSKVDRKWSREYTLNNLLNNG